MFFKLTLLLFALSFIVCGPHNPKVDGFKEQIQDGIFPSRDSKHYKDGKHNYDFDHEAILGSHDAVEEFDHLPPEEAKNRLLTLAIKMDENKDQYVDKKELTDWVLRSFKMLTEEEALDELEDEDINEDGKVTWDEHVTATFSLHNEGKLIYKNIPEEAQMYENDMELFKAADLDGNGNLDKTEFSSFSHPEEFEHMHEIVYKQAMKKRDTNSDGFLSFEEFIADNYGSMPLETTETFIMEKDRFDNDFDIDGDKRLNKEEVLMWIIPNNVESAETEADHLVESSDTDKDGKLSYYEIIQHFDIFVGSEVTDFGEQLHMFHKFNDEL